MKSIKILAVIALAILPASCKKSAEISVMNGLSNVAIKNVSFGKDIYIHSGTLLPGQSSGKKTISNDSYYYDMSFPLSRQVQFYMTSGSNSIYLETKEFFRLDEDAHLHIEIGDDTEVINPLTGNTQSLARHVKEMHAD